MNRSAKRLRQKTPNATQWCGWPAGILAIAITAIVQCLVGTLGGAESAWRLDRPYYADYWYYAGLAQALIADFPPHNPAFAGYILSQYNFHLAPLAVLSVFMSPYFAMRLLNILYGVLLLLLLRRYLPRSFGLAGLCLLATAPIVFDLNPLSIDLLTRGFHHQPFILLALVAILEVKRPFLRCAAIFLLPWVHGLMALAFALMVGLATRSQWKLYWAVLLSGFVSAGAGVWVISGGQGGAELWHSLGWQPAEPLRHLFPLVIVLFCVRPPLWVFGGAAALLMATIFDWNRFYFLFGLNFALSMAAAEAALCDSRGKRRAAILSIVAAIVSAVISGYGQLHRHQPYDRRPVAAAIEWVNANTPRNAVFLQAPASIAMLESDEPYRRGGFGYWVLESRPLFIAFPPWATDLGLPGVARAREAIAYFRGEAPSPTGVDYVFYGPMEQSWFPRFAPGSATVAYRDEHVEIFKIAGDAKNKVSGN